MMPSQNIQALQAQFMLAAQQRIYTLREVMRLKTPSQQSMLYMNLCEEEFGEIEKCFQKYLNAVREDEKLACISDLLDNIADMAVVMMGLCNTLGLPFHEAYAEVHKANMNKFIDDGAGGYKVLKRADGKVIKPNEWKPPNIIDILKYKIIVGE